MVNGVKELFLSVIPASKTLTNITQTIIRWWSIVY